MTSLNKLEILNGFVELTDDLRKKPASDAYWKKEGEALFDLRKTRKKRDRGLSMSKEKLHECFSL